MSEVELYQPGLDEHCMVAALIISEMGLNPHTKHHIRSAVREATLKVTPKKGSSKDKATLMSESALKQMLEGNKDKLVLEHVVPVSFINKLVLAEGMPAWQRIREIIIEWTLLSVITKNEEQMLKTLKLNQSMPSEWDGVDKYARYKVAGIELVASRYKELKKGS